MEAENTCHEDIVYTASIMEKVARDTKNTIRDVARYVGFDYMAYVAEYADVNHCLPLQQVADEMVEDNVIPTGSFDNITQRQYKVPSVIDIGKVYARLVRDSEADVEAYPQALYKVLTSEITEMISDFNASWYYASSSELAYEYSKMQKDRQ